MGSIVPTQGQRHHHSLVAPGDYNGQPPEDVTTTPTFFDVDDYYVFGESHSKFASLPDDDESSISVDDASDINSKSNASHVIYQNSGPPEDVERHHTTNTKRKCPTHTDLNNDAAIPNPQTKDLLSYQERTIFNLEREVHKLRSTCTLLKKEKSVLRANIASYYEGNCNNNCSHKTASDKIDVKATIANDTSSTAEVSSSVSARDCVSEAVRLMSTIQSYNVSGRSHTFLERVAAELVDVLWDETCLSGRLQECFLN
ncbi:hypothetical protein ACA910_013780 [Epithemia clementina (nom. ined.)]